MSINGWIKILSIIFGVDVSKRLDSVAINYDALNDILVLLGERKTRVLELTIDQGMSKKDAAAVMGLSASRVSSLHSHAMYYLRAINPEKGYRELHLVHRAVLGWWNLKEPISPLSVKATTHVPRKLQKAQSASCLVITNFNKPVVTTTVVEKEVIRVEKERVVREPRWYETTQRLPKHADRVIALNANMVESEDKGVKRGKMWFAVFDADSKWFRVSDGEPILISGVTHWCELPTFTESPKRQWDFRTGAYFQYPRYLSK